MPGKPLPVPETKVNSINIPNWAAGVFLGGDSNGPNNSFIRSKDVELDKYGYMIPRRRLAPFLPDTVETTYQKASVLWNGNLYYFTLDYGKVKFCQEGDAGWTDCTSSNLLSNPGFEVDMTGWTGTLSTVSRITTDHYAGVACAKIIGNASHPAIMTHAFTYVVGQTYTVQARVKGTAGQSVYLISSGNGVSPSFVLTGGWDLISWSFKPVVAVSTIGVQDDTLASTIYLDAVTVDNSNAFITNHGGMPKFIRILDNVLILNGKNGDKLAYVNLSSAGFPVVHYTLVTDPPSALTGALTSIVAGAYSIYYAYNYSGAVGETLLSPILTKSINVTRDQWQTMGTPGSIKLTRPAGAPPTGAKFWNLYIALAATGGTIQPSDMLRVATGLDLANFDFVDDGSLSFDLGAVPPEVNSTDGPRVSDGIVEDGNPILFQDEDNPYNIWIAGGGPNAMDFSAANGGYRAEPEKGTNFYPTVIVGFRTGQGVPALTVLYSNTEGLSKQAVLQQQTVNYGDQSFTVWGVTEQHYGAAGVAAANSAINYNGKLLFLSTDGVSSAETQPSIQNVLSIKSTSSPIDSYIRSVLNSAMPSVVGAGWNKKYMWLIPNAGFNTPQQIAILDTNNKGVEGDGAWYFLDIPAQWIGVVSPKSAAAFVYISQGNKTYKLLLGASTYDTINGASVPFSTSAIGPLVGMGGDAHDQWRAVVQAMFYVVGLVGEMTIGVTYRNQNGRLKTKTRTIHGPTYVPSSAGGWGDPHYIYAESPLVAGWGVGPAVGDSSSAFVGQDKREAVPIDDIANECQWFYSTPAGYSSYKMRAIGFQGVDLGVSPDLK